MDVRTICGEAVLTATSRLLDSMPEKIKSLLVSATVSNLAKKLMQVRDLVAVIRLS